MAGPPYYASPTSPLNVGISASQAAAVGDGTLTVQGTSGTLTHSATLNTSVTAEVTFQLNVSPTTVTIGPNGTATAQVTLVPGSNFGSSSVFLYSGSVHVGNSGVDMALSSQDLMAAQPQATVSFTSGLRVETGTFPVDLTGTLGAQVVKVPLSLTVTNPAKPCNGLSRSAVTRTDMNPTGVVYDPIHKLVFAAVQQTNSLEVFSSTTAQKVATIPVAAPRQLDITPDGSRILVGTLTNYLYWVDTASLQVAGNVGANSPIFNGWSIQPYRPVVLASGKVLVQSGAYPPDEWDPLTNAWSDPALSGFDSTGDVDIRRSADHTKVVVAAVNGNTLAMFDSATDRYGPVQNISAKAAALNSNGSRIAVLSSSPTLAGGNQLTLYDQDFKALATCQLMGGSDLIFSRDDNTLFVQGNDNTATALSTTDLAFLGQVPSPGFAGVDYPSDIDETNMIFSPGLARTVTFTDAGSPCALGVDQPINIALTPAQGELNAPSSVTLRAGTGITAESKVYFGAAPASPQAAPGTNLAPNPPTSIQLTTPISTSAGAVNVTVTNPDGSISIAPDAFSYGSSVLQVATNSGPATGGTSVTIFGYGLAFDSSQIQVTVGGKAAAVTRAFAGAGISPFPFPMDQVTITTPAGIPGPADIVITTPAGTATAVGGFHYLQTAQDYATSNTLTEAVYDPLRQRLYAADGGSNVVDVFDLSARTFLTPIVVGKAPQALALTPDDNTLVVSNGADSTISTVDLTGVSATKTVSVATLPDLPSQCGKPIPYAMATTSNNKAVVALTCPDVTEGEYTVLDLATQTIGCGTSQSCSAMLAAFPQNKDWVLTVAGTSNGRSILFSNGVTMGLWDVGADAFIAKTLGNAQLQFPVVQTAAAADGTAFAQLYGTFDPLLSQFSVMQDVDYLKSGVNDLNGVPGEKMNPSGSLLYIPENNGFSIYDVHQGHLKRRVVLAAPTASTFDALTIDDTGSRVFLLTATGLSVVEIADLPLSIGNLQPAQGSAAGGTAVSIRGSGFQNGSQVLFNNTSVSAQFVDGFTLQVTSPAVDAGAIRITVVNPNGDKYSLDDAFNAQ